MALRIASSLLTGAVTATRAPGALFAQVSLLPITNQQAVQAYPHSDKFPALFCPGDLVNNVRENRN